MSKAKWTPGPWVIESDINSNEAASDTLVMTPDGAHIIARTTEDANALGWDQAEANARLIAAAPDLYAALAGWLDRDCAGEGCGDGCHDRARAALAKARGEQP